MSFDISQRVAGLCLINLVSPRSTAQARSSKWDKHLTNFVCRAVLLVTEKKRKNSGSYVIRYRCSALSIKPTGSRSLNWFVINPWKLRMMTKLWIYEKYICELRSEELYEERSSQFYTQILQLRKESLKKPEFFLQAFFSQLQKFVYIWFCFI